MNPIFAKILLYVGEKLAVVAAKLIAKAAANDDGALDKALKDQEEQPEISEDV